MVDPITIAMVAKVGMDIVGGIMDSNTKKNQAKIQAYAIQTQASAQAAQSWANVVPELQTISSQARIMSAQQTIAFYNNGVNPAKGTALAITLNTLDKANLAMSETMTNTQTYVNNLHAIANAQAAAVMAQGEAAASASILSGLSSALGTGLSMFSGGASGGASGGSLIPGSR
jgi:hypothetical protein